MRDLVSDPFWMAFGISAVLSWPNLLLMRRLKADASISQWTPEHAGKVGTPSMGGIAPIIGLLFATLYLFYSRENVWLLSIAIGIVGFAFIGFVDDFWIPRKMAGKRGFGWTLKLVLQLVVTAAMVWSLDLPIRESIIAGFCIVFFANAVNFSDGLDGLCGGLLILAVVAFTRWELSSVAYAMIGCIIPFLFLNAPPAKIFMGDVGALPFGATYGVLFAEFAFSDDYFGDVPLMVPALLVISLIFILELSLVPLQLFWVKVFKRRLIPASPVHHSFEKLGWPETRITAAFLLTQLLLTMLGWQILEMGAWVL